MAIEEIKVIELRGRTVEILGEKIGPKQYRFTAKCDHIIRQSHVSFNDTVNLEYFQRIIDLARQTIAEEAVSHAEHEELEAQVD